MMNARAIMLHVHEGEKDFISLIVFFFFHVDTVRMMDSYCDVLVLRHPEPLSAKVCK